MSIPWSCAVGWVCPSGPWRPELRRGWSSRISEHQGGHHANETRRNAASGRTSLVKVQLSGKSGKREQQFFHETGIFIKLKSGNILKWRGLTMINGNSVYVPHSYALVAPLASRKADCAWQKWAMVLSALPIFLPIKQDSAAEVCQRCVRGGPAGRQCTVVEWKGTTLNF